MAKNSPVVLADQLCTVVLEVRAFGEANSPYLTRLENEIRKRGWRLGVPRIQKIQEELQDRTTQIEALMQRLGAALNEFGRTPVHETNILHRYWNEADRVRFTFIGGARDILRQLPSGAFPTKGKGTL
jgi:hypothetical protein